MGANTAWADDWYTSGSEVAAGSDYYLYNIGAGKFLDNGMAWGTYGTVDNSGQSLTLAAGSNGGYTIYTGLKTNESLGGDNDYYNGAWMNQGSTEFIFESVTLDGFTNAYKIKDYTSSKYLVYVSTNPTIELAELTSSNNDYWLLIPKTTRTAAGDYTFLMKNASMNAPWENHVWTAAGYFEACNFSGGNTDNKCAEVYNGIFDFYQQITDVPNGKYTLTCQGFYRGTESTLYANGYTVAMKNITSETGTTENMNDASTAFSADKYQNTLNFVVANGTIQIGIQKLTTAWADWNIFTNFKLTRTGDATTDDQNTAISTAHAWAVSCVTTAKDHFAMSADNRTALGTALTTYATSSANNVTALLTAYNTALYDGAGNGVTDLTLYIRDIIALDNVNDFRTYLYDHGSTINEWANVQACHSGFELAKIQDASSTDYTPMIRNAAVTVANYGWWGTVTDNGSAPYTGAPDNIYLANTEGAEYNVNQNVYGLPAGKYEATTWTYSSVAGDRNQYIAIVSPWTDINVEAQGGSREVANAAGWVKVTSTFILAESTDVAFGFYAGAVTDRIAGFDNWTLTRTGDASISVTVSDAGMATYVNNNYDLDFSETSIKAYKAKVNTKGVCTLTEVANVPAKPPVLLVKDGGATEYVPVMTGAAAVSDNDLVAGTGTAVTTDGGTDGGVAYTNMILNKVDDKVGFYFAAGQTVATNRAYLHIASSLAPDAESGGEARRMVMVFDGEATNISTVLGEGTKANGYYNLNGQRVTAPQKGLYIVNGKKVVVK